MHLMREVVVMVLGAQLLLLLVMLLLLLLRRCQFVLLLDALLQVHLGVSLLLVGAGKLAAANVAGEGLLTGVRPNVRRQVVRTRERPHAYSALERLLARVDANVARQFVGPRKATVTVLDGTCVWPLVHWRLARAVRVLSRLDGH